MLTADDGGSTWTCFNMQLEGLQSIWGRQRLTYQFTETMLVFLQTNALVLVERAL